MSKFSERLENIHPRQGLRPINNPPVKWNLCVLASLPSDRRLPWDIEVLTRLIPASVLRELPLAPKSCKGKVNRAFDFQPHKSWVCVTLRGSVISSKCVCQLYVLNRVVDDELKSRAKVEDGGGCALLHTIIDSIN